jgi:hypothetical protein
MAGITFLSAHALAEGEKKGFHVDGGAYLTHLKQRSQAPDGFADKVSSMTGFLRFRATRPLGARWSWEPGLGVLVPWKSGVDGAEKKITTLFDFTFTYALLKWLHLRLGPGIKWNFSFSDGGAVVLNNGTGTSTFYTPAYSSHSFTVTVQTGLTLELGRKITLNLECYTSGLLSQLRRNIDAAVTLGWRI